MIRQKVFLYNLLYNIEISLDKMQINTYIKA